MMKKEKIIIPSEDDQAGLEAMTEKLLQTKARFIYCSLGRLKTKHRNIPALCMCIDHVDNEQFAKEYCNQCYEAVMDWYTWWKNPQWKHAAFFGDKELIELAKYQGTQNVKVLTALTEALFAQWRKYVEDTEAFQVIEAVIKNPEEEFTRMRHAEEVERKRRYAEETTTYVE